MPSTVTSAPFTTAVRIVVEPVGTGTLCAEPMSLPLSSGITRPIAFAAPVELGTMFAAPALALLRSPFHDTALDRSILVKSISHRSKTVCCARCS